MAYKKVRGWTSGRSLPVLNFVKYPPPQLVFPRYTNSLKGLFVSQVKVTGAIFYGIPLKA